MKVRSDMDESGNSLMGMHGYCTQELVNLILTGTLGMHGYCTQELVNLILTGTFAFMVAPLQNRYPSYY